MAGAYRCPVCGVDFPSGTPGAPDNVDDAFDAGVRFGGTSPPPPENSAADDVLDIAPGAGATFRDGEPGAPRRDDPAPRMGGANLDVRPSEGKDGARTPGATLSVRPAREAGTVTLSERDRNAAGEDAPRRSWARGLAGTLFSALVLLALVAGGAWWLDLRGALPGLTAAGPEPVTVGVDDGWVNLQTDERALVVSADGPFRLRIAGKVYSLRGDRAVQVPAQVEASIRVVRAPATATVRPR